MKVIEYPRANARCFEIWKNGKLVPQLDGADKPIMQIYQKPGTGTSASGRIQYALGKVVYVYKEPIVATGGGRFHQIHGLKGAYGEKLYLPKESLMKLV